MTVMKNLLLLISSFFIISGALSAQTADVTSGCIPLTVNFTAPNSAEYFWDFNDGNSSDDKDPEHIFTRSGNFRVVLYTDASQSTQVGTIDIIVYPDLIVDFNSNHVTGCNPSDITFAGSIDHHPEITITNVLWTFGDGSSANIMNPTHTYNSVGLFDVSLAVTTNLSECDKTILKEDYITISEQNADFDVDISNSCTAPLTVNITNQSDNIDGFMYLWDYDGNGTDSGYNPAPVTFNRLGRFRITLTMVAPDGCETTRIRTIRIGVPDIEFSLADTVCTGTSIRITNSSSGIFNTWDFGPDADPMQSGLKSPVVTYDTPGIKTVTYTSRTGSCQSDTTFTILVSDNISGFTVEPQIICTDSVVFMLTANHSINGDYFWNGSTVPGGPDTTYLHYEPITDTFQVNRLETFQFSLIIDSEELACVDTTTVEFESQVPEAFFIPDSVIGVVPLTMGFLDGSESDTTIVDRIWDFGDGNTADDEEFVQHTYTEPGEYFVKLWIENADGCSDLSQGVTITVLEEKTIECILDSIGLEPIDLDGVFESRTLCVGDQVRWIQPRFRDYVIRLQTDEGRFDHCAGGDDNLYTFLYPGFFEANAILEFKGFELDFEKLGYLPVLGARAEIGYKKDCDSPFDTNFWSRQVGNIDTYTWYYDDRVISREEKFSFTFDAIGEHEVILEIQSLDEDCPPHRDTAIVYVTEPIASFLVDDILCEGVPNPLDATTTSLTAGCSNPYLWTFDMQRPREVMTEIAQHAFERGEQSIMLTVTDINGCTSTAEADVSVLGTEIEFPLDSSLCLPHESFFDTQIDSDTAIVSYNWTFGSSEMSPTYVFTEGDLAVDSLGARKDSLFVTLFTEDAFGCLDSLEKATRLYTPVSNIIVEDDGVCRGDAFQISADDFREEGSRLSFDWDFASGGTCDQQACEVIFAEPGEQIISLFFEELGTMCRDTILDTIQVLERPEASFTTNVDGMSTICYPSTIEFNNTSVVDGGISYEWDFGNGATSDLTSPAISYDRGTFTASLTATSVFGCEDVQTFTFELVGPDGDLVIDKDNICLGESVELSLINPLDVASFDWDLGDGNVISNEDNIIYTYDFKPPGDSTDIDLILSSGANGCEVIRTVAININDVEAGFEQDLSIDWCVGLVGFFNNSRGASSFEWDFGDGSISTEELPLHTYNSSDTYDVSLRVTDDVSGCVSEFTQQIDVTLEENDFFSFANVFTPNGDGRNDFFRAVIPDIYQDVVTTLSFKIFDRRGQLLYDNASPDGWDGTVNGTPVPEDVYAYFIEIDIQDCQVVSDKGNVTLVR